MLIVGDWAPEKTKVVLNIEQYVILSNLEGPIINNAKSNNERKKVGPYIHSNEFPESKCWFVFTAANNHFFDYGLNGFNSSKKISKKLKNIKIIGAGRNKDESRKHYIYKENGIEFGVSRVYQAGVAEIGAWIYEEIIKLKNKVKYIIISVHAGNEDFPIPNPYIRELYKSFIDVGASVIHGHHSHVAQCYEEYKNGIIFYGMGNFAVDYKKWNNCKNCLWSLAAELKFEDNKISWKIFTLKIECTNYKEITIKKTSYEENVKYIRYLNKYNKIINNERLYEATWQELALHIYFSQGAKNLGILWFNKTYKKKLFVMILNILKQEINTFIDKIVNRKSSLLLKYHMISCESHRQMLYTALGILSGEILDLRTSKSKCIIKEIIDKDW